MKVKAPTCIICESCICTLFLVTAMSLSWGIYFLFEKSITTVCCQFKTIYTRFYQVDTYSKTLGILPHYLGIYSYTRYIYGIYILLDRQIPYEARMSRVPAASHHGQIFEKVQPFKFFLYKNHTILEETRKEQIFLSIIRKSIRHYFANWTKFQIWQPSVSCSLYLLEQE